MAWAMHISQSGIDLIKRFEGFRSKAYPDPGPRGESLWTIGYGSTRDEHGQPFKAGDTITLERAEKLLIFSIDRFERALNKVLQVDVRQHQFDALMSFAYNCAGWESSTLIKLINQGRFTEAASEFEKWNKSSGKVLKGLTHRRLAEKNMFLGLTAPPNEQQ